MKLLSLLKTEITGKLKKLTATGWNGKSRALSAEQLGPYGFDSRPVKDMVGLYLQTEKDGDEVWVGWLNKNCLAAIGETRLFSTDASGTLKAYIWLKNDGIAYLNSTTGANGGLIKIDNLISQNITQLNAIKAAVVAGFSALSGLDSGASLSAFNTAAAAIQGLQKTPLENPKAKH